MRTKASSGASSRTNRPAMPTSERSRNIAALTAFLFTTTSSAQATVRTERMRKSVSAISE